MIRRTPGGNELVVDGTLTIEAGATLKAEDGATVTGLSGEAYTLPTAAANTKGGVKIGANLEMTGEVLTVKKAALVAEAAGEAPTAAEFKALLDALKTAGLMATS